jgi:hypothetical protein
MIGELDHRFSFIVDESPFGIRHYAPSCQPPPIVASSRI